ncbi:MAG: shikimate kinase [Candidatus Omnitrophota bacterium]|jgi:shikimate kinase|nr:shikimate kinase [Candidatus Omnitrophota bacterium]
MINSNNIIIIGFMGAGKSMVANELANIYQRSVVSTDQLIEQREKRSIKDIFVGEGEAYFRQVEKEIVKEVSQQKNLIIDCGGGVIIDADNRQLLKKSGIIIYLSASPGVLLERIQKTQERPLLNVTDQMAKIEELLAQRRTFYEQADYTISTDHKSVAEVCQEIKEVIA